MNKEIEAIVKIIDPTMNKAKTETSQAVVRKELV
jgi:hypothetical protein